MKQFDTQSYVYGDEMSRDWLQLFSPKSSQRYGNYGLVERFTIHYKEKTPLSHDGAERWKGAFDVCDHNKELVVHEEKVIPPCGLG